MGFLKKMFNKATGRAAEVTCEVEDTSPGGTTTVTSSVTVKDEPITIEGISTEIQLSQKTVMVADYDYTDGIDKTTYTLTRVWSDKVDHAGPGTLDAGSEHPFTATFTIPAGAHRSEGQDWVWQARTAVAMDGNDPDSGWKTFKVT